MTRSTVRSLLLCALVAIGTAPVLAGCGSDAEDAAAVEAAPPPGDTFVGSYKVRGRTEDPRRGSTREIRGMVVITESEGVFTAHSELESEYPVEGGMIDTDVLGTGTGTREGNVLRGDAETQLVMGTVPGVATDFAFVPRSVGPRIGSSWQAHFRRDGTLVVSLENKPLPGEDYAPTKTTLFGKRLDEAARK